MLVYSLTIFSIAVTNIILLVLLCAKKKNEPTYTYTKKGEVNVTLDSTRTTTTNKELPPDNNNHNNNNGNNNKPQQQQNAGNDKPKVPPPPPKVNQTSTFDASSKASKTQDDEKKFVRGQAKGQDQNVVQKKAKWAFFTHLFRKEESKKKKNEEEKKKQEALQKIAAEMKTIEQDDVPATQQYRDSELQATQQGSDKENKKSKKNKNTITCATLEASVAPTQENTLNTTKGSDKERKSKSGKSCK